LEYWSIEGDTFEQKLPNFPDKQLVHDLHGSWTQIKNLITLEGEDAKIFDKLAEIVKKLADGKT
jgi:hypothetical protein